MDTEYEPPSYSTCDGVSPRCPVEFTVYGDYFTTGACAFFVAIYAVLLIAQSYLGYRSKAWSYISYLAIGTAFELMGYAARIALSYNPWNYPGFVVQLLMLILAPTLVAAAISITCKHLVVWYGPRWSFLRPSLYPWVFVGTDFMSILIQAVGGAVSAVASDSEDMAILDVGSGLLVAGVAFQLANMVFCGGLMVLYLLRRRRGLKNGNGAERLGSSAADDSEGSGAESWAPYRKASPEMNRKVEMFIYAVSVAYLAIIVRCIYRIPEMSNGWGSELMQNETTFLVLDGAMVLVAALVLTVVHPLFFFPYLGNKDIVGKQDTISTPAEQHEMNVVQQS
ncbi:RTA1-domain-containing protein [Sodiomyces alkalinus F11]|uniref:RTA1-domain-containing protein n=1 Tax=Sodiomyces alkalinus (strain CBS 110278 / VKM F-3762 / F11) TaxID=1314773 RepID=A0A3N2PV95_SODAK|nr:RTA1-domain-containing protein [Sodiomyces alkalinus F11]ROT38266.1 RTA1-domain-containing protein [Sodiomyces alkalinus F11]